MTIPTNDKVCIETQTMRVQNASKDLPPGSRALFHYLCAIKEDDRKSDIVKLKWNYILSLFKLDKISLIEDALTPLLESNLIQKASAEEKLFEYRLDPVVASIGLNEIDRNVLISVYEEMATSHIFQCVFLFSLDEDQLEDKSILSQEALKAIYYYQKLGIWDVIFIILKDLTNHNLSSEAIAELLPLVRQVVEHTAGTKSELPSLELLEKLLTELSQYEEAEKVSRDIIIVYINEGEYGLAFYKAKCLANVLIVNYCYKDALEMYRQALKCGYLAEKTNHWPETRIVDKISRYLAIAECHYDMAVCMENCGLDSISHFFVAGIIFLQVGSEYLDFTIETIFEIMQRSESSYGYGLLNLPQSYDELCQMVTVIREVDFNNLFTKLPQRVENGNIAFNIVLEKILAATGR